MSVPAPVVCEPQVPPCCEGAPVFYGQGKTYLSAQTGFLLTCPPGFSCDAGAYPHPIIVPHGTIPFTPPTGANPLRITCCDGVVLASYLPDGFTQAQFDAAAQSLVDQAAEHLAQCMAADYNAENAKRRTNCVITTSSPLTPASVGVPYAVQLQQAGAVGDVVWTVTSGALPSGFSLSADGLLSGTTMIGGAFSFVVQATHDNGSCKRVFNIVISSDVPCDLGLADNTIVGDRSVNTCLATSTDSWTGLPIGTYTIEYVSGGVLFNNFDTDPNPPFNCIPTGTDSWVANPAGFSFGTDSNARAVFNGSTRDELPWHSTGLTCGRLTTSFTSLANLEANFVGNPGYGFGPPMNRVTPPRQNLTDTITIEVDVTYAAFTSFVPVTWRLTRTHKTAIDYDIQVRIVDLTTALSSLTPFDSCTAGSGTVWDGTLPDFDPNFNYVNYEYRVTSTFNPFQLNSCLLDTPTAVKVYHDTAGQSTPTGCAWILAVTYVHPVQGNVVSWVGLGGNGYSPVGTYVFASDVVGWTMFGLKTAVRAATTTALPANTRTLNVLTADVNGAFPTIDGVSLNVADRVLVKNEVLAANNGVYTVTSLGSGILPWVLTRSTDLDTSGEMLRGIFMPVTAGATLAGQHFRLVTNGVITLNTTALSFTSIQQSIAVESY